MSSLYFDTTYLCKLRWPENGSAEVCACACASTSDLATALHGRAEFYAVGLRKRREGTATQRAVLATHAQFNADIAAGDIRILPLTDAVMQRVETVFATAPATTYLRAADALHLATAAEPKPSGDSQPRAARRANTVRQNGFTEIYSNDIHLLAAAPLFGLLGVNVIP
jgi:predicted nucleic acid-binding protein